MSASADAPPSVLCVIDTQSLDCRQHRPPSDRTAYSLCLCRMAARARLVNAARVLHSTRAQ
eukprot:11769953-Heterocapsa_arctica.AAC.1